MQQPDGHWSDYDIRDQVTLAEREPIGASDQWVTAYAGLALAEAMLICGVSEARAGAERASDWLNHHRTYSAGWGFNARTGADVDSTAHAVLLHRRLGRCIASRDLNFLASGACPAGGFATFPSGPGEWGRAHADVTAPALLALPAGGRKRLLAGTGAFLSRARAADGSWPGYWWKTPHYATYFTLRAGRALGLDIDGPIQQPPNHEALDNPCDMAFAAGIELHRSGPNVWVDRLVNRALDGQMRKGGWHGTTSLRVPRQGDATPWSHTSSPLYRDQNGILTTAHIVRVMARIACWPVEFSEAPEEGARSN